MLRTCPRSRKLLYIIIIIIIIRKLARRGRYGARCGGSDEDAAAARLRGDCSPHRHRFCALRSCAAVSQSVASVHLLQVPVEEVEWQFWNIVTTPDKPLEVRARHTSRSCRWSTSLLNAFYLCRRGFSSIMPTVH